MSARFEIDYEDVKQLQEKFAKIPGKVEEHINTILHNFGVKTVQDTIITRIPVSKKKGKVEKKHAKNSRPLRSITFNLGFETKPKKPYRYLVFPDKGLGTSVHNSPDEFMIEGMNSSTPRIMQEINKKVDQLIKEEF
ncbi:hypothetical protein [Pseudalkalibacillus caeni]|uniref:HK97 gp10 family phage protein n=1 Tax=Exobacillus caeni TaxID=2574798 RepID=A0A5R9F5H6_9BACL|nr:hypothetical protein [Pseudalkalibacillus caeni]TLS37739.1 hypothetical protein FCL54_07910 [Pseudalkalibacillus caeni]